MNAVYRFQLTQNASANGIKSSNVLKIKKNYVIMISSFRMIQFGVHKCHSNHLNPGWYADVMMVSALLSEILATFGLRWLQIEHL